MKVDMLKLFTQKRPMWEVLGWSFGFLMGFNYLFIVPKRQKFERQLDNARNRYDADYRHIDEVYRAHIATAIGDLYPPSKTVNAAELEAMLNREKSTLDGESEEKWKDRKM